MHAPRRPDANRRPSRGQLSLVPDDGTHAYGPFPRRTDGRLDWGAARRIVLDDRDGTALRPQNHRVRRSEQTAIAAVDALRSGNTITTQSHLVVRFA